MSSAKLAVVVGATPVQRVPAQVCERSVVKRASCPVRIIHTFDKDLPRPEGPTGFSYIRFAAPELAGRKGRVLYLDSDMLILGDVKELMELDLQGFDVLAPENQSAVMLINAETAPFSLESVCSTMKGKWNNTVMQLRGGLSGAKVSRTLSGHWNMLDNRKLGTKNLHFTNMRNQPWLPSRPLRHHWADVWFAELKLAVEEGFVRIEDIEEDISRGHLHAECLKVPR